MKYAGLAGRGYSFWEEPCGEFSGRRDAPFWATLWYTFEYLMWSRRGIAISGERG